MDASLTCSADQQCDDGVFCNGQERCAPDDEAASELGCVAGTPPCLAGQRCDEPMGLCATLCDVSTDADGDGVAALDCGGNDCDDSDPDRYPGNPELCDALGVDEDCDPTTVGERDVDGDGHIDAACCNGDVCGTDCADRMPSVNPSAPEVCDLVDQDCDGDVDEGVQSAGFEDRDGDRHGDPSRARMACAFDGDVAPGMDDCADDDGRRHGQMLEICDGQDNDCDGSIDEERFSVSWYADADGDGFGDPGGEVRASCEPIEGFSTLPFDCDDTDPARSPITPEVCNGLDDDCDGRADFQLEAGDTEDDDGDGVADARCPGGAGLDCDDRDPFAKPGTPELCDGVDNDCDGTVDEGATEVYWYVDDDGDGFGDDAAERRASCARVPGLVLEGGDCDDGDGEVRPGSRERCNGVDDDCDGTTDEDAGFVATYADDDGDGFGTGMPLAQCAVAGFRSLTPGDCDDANGSSRPGAPELCDGLDNDCDGTVDEAIGTVAVTTYLDADGDGFGDPATALSETPLASSCTPDPTRTTLAGDCDDADRSRFPAAPELCDSVDQDCDGSVDEDAGDVLQYPDGDGDGFGAGSPVTSCSAIAGHALRAGDCDDASPTARPGAAERCNGADDDCDGVTDEAPAGWLDCPLDATNATPTCTAGVCGYGECLPGFGDCDGTSTNGCEVVFASDPSHCGACGSACGLGDTCSAASCDRLPVDDVATSANAGCALRAGQVFCWGDDRGTAGPLGDGSDYRELAYAPIRPVLGLVDAVSVHAGAAHFCALRMTGDAVCWGQNGGGQLGDGTTVGAEAPTTVIGGHRFAQLGAFGTYTCGRDMAGAVWCWGTRAGASASTSPVEVLRGGVSMDAIELGVGAAHVCVISGGDGRVYCAGWNTDEQLGIDGLEHPEFGTPVAGLTTATQLGLGGATSCARLADGSVWCWGSGSSGVLGDGTTVGRRDPAPVTGSSDALRVEVGSAHACAIRTDRSLVCWGANDRLQLGDPTFTDAFVATPRSIPGLTDVIAVDVHERTSTGAFGPVCAVEANAVYCWGPGQTGRSGDGSTANVNRAPPVQVLGFP